MTAYLNPVAILKPLAHNSAGLGLRRQFLQDLLTLEQGPDFVEIAPENWLGMGGRYQKQLQAIAEKFPIVCHGLSLSIGGPHPLDEKFLSDLKSFFQQYSIDIYSEHLSFTGDEGHLYDLLPIPFTEEAVHYVANRVRHVQDRLERRLVLENVSYYAPMPNAEMSELDFFLNVIKEADCDILLDVNNVYVNSINHGDSAHDFIKAIPAERVRYCHMAGHHEEAPDFCIDTHGNEIIQSVWDLLAFTYQTMGVKPTLLERDFNIPPLSEVLSEVAMIRDYQYRYQKVQVR